MASSKTMIWFVALLLVLGSAQHLGIDSIETHGICKDVYCDSIPETLQKLRNCVVVKGNLRVAIMENSTKSDFKNTIFPNLREVTGFVVVYRVKGLESLAQLFPNLTRIRGTQLLINYGLIVYDVENLRELGLYSLLKIDRGGVNIWGGNHTCYIDTVDWNAIAPNSRHIIAETGITAHCSNKTSCKCKDNKRLNYCWRARKCQRFVSGPRAEKCHEECLGCGSSPDICSVCRHYTYRGSCMSHCPAHTIVLPDNQYCVTKEECRALKGWVWNNTCVFECPVNYRVSGGNDTVTCEQCSDCQKVCSSLTIDSLSGVQRANGCVHVIGSLTIHVRFVPGFFAELAEHLSLIQTVDDYILIYGSQTIKSLDFLSSLNRISGKNLKNETYSLIVHDMLSLEKLFSEKVMKQLTIDRGSLRLYNNPKLCTAKVSEIAKKFPDKPNSTDIPMLLNGYSGGCEDSLALKVQVLNETTANVRFKPHKDPSIQYAVLYSRIPAGIREAAEPETCRSEWYAANTIRGEAILTSLHPASTYAVCIETYTFSHTTLQTYLARTKIVNFITPFKKPEPPFIRELAAVSLNSVTLRWIDHKDYRHHITHYQLDVILIEIPERDLKVRDHCNTEVDLDFHDSYNRHALVFKIPEDYEVCGSQCRGLTTTVFSDNFIEDNFDVCSVLDLDCDNHEEPPSKNSSFKNYIRTLTLILREQGEFNVTGLAPFRDYKFRLRACAGDKCSRSTRQVIRTLRSNKADVPSITEWGLNDTGHLYVRWVPPDITNGPLLAYTVQILSRMEEKQDGTIPDTVCVYPEHLFLIVRLKSAKEYSFRVCSATLGSLSACTKWRLAVVPDDYGLLVISFIFSILLAIFSFGVGFYSKRENKLIDAIPLVDSTSMNRSESDPPNAVLPSDFLPFYTVPFNDALLDT